jgi:hypothetical protein
MYRYIARICWTNCRDLVDISICLMNISKDLIDTSRDLVDILEI